MNPVCGLATLVMHIPVTEMAFKTHRKYVKDVYPINSLLHSICYPVDLFSRSSGVVGICDWTTVLWLPQSLVDY